jgi:hypothetical protein
VNTEEDLWRLSYFIRHTFTEDSLRLRAAFIWITKNIEYDIKAFQNDDNRAAQLHYVLRKKRAICSGYANLLKYFCDTYKIENELITGRARALRSDIHIMNMRFQSNHAWNAVKINNQWRLIDPTWAAGVITDEDERDEVVKVKYQASLEEYYYFTPPERFSLNHYPSDLRFSFVPKTGTYKEFAQAPLLTTEYLKGTLSAVSPNLALVEARVGDTLTFRFRSKEPIHDVNFFSKREKAGCISSAKEVNGWYEVQYPVVVTGYYDVNLAFNDDRFASVVYKVRIGSKL